LRDNLIVIASLPEWKKYPLNVAKVNKPQKETFGRRGLADEADYSDDQQMLDHHKLFEHSRVIAQHLAKEECCSEAAMEEFINRHGNAVGLIGVAGIGKTTLLKDVAGEILESFQSQNTQVTPLVFYIAFRKMNCQVDCNILRFLTSTMLPEWNHSPEGDEVLLETIKSSDYVYIFMDGLDEAAGFSLTDEVQMTNLFDEARPDVIFKNLISGRLLPKAKKLVTSRTRVYYSLHPTYRPELTGEVLGIRREFQQQLFQRLCSRVDSDQAATQLFQRNSSLSSVSFAPLFCKLLAHYLSAFTQQPRVIYSFTALFVCCLDQIMRSENFTGDEASIRQLAQLAFEKIRNNKFVFDLSESEPLSPSNINAFKTIIIDRRRDIKLSIVEEGSGLSFSHISWQEFFAALYVTYFVSDERLWQEYFAHFDAPRFDSVVKFMLGLSNAAAQSVLRGVPGASFSSSKLTKLKRKIIENLEREQTQRAISRDYPPLTDFIDLPRLPFVVHRLFARNDPALVKITSWLHELHDESFTSEMAERFPSRLFIHGLVSPDENSCIIYLLKNANASKQISVGAWNTFTNFSEGCLEVLLQALESSHHKVSCCTVY